MDFVAPSTSVKRNRAHNVDTNRLRCRRAFIISNVLGGKFDGPRCDFAARAYELQAIENVLVRREALAMTDRRTLHANDHGLA